MRTVSTITILLAPAALVAQAPAEQGLTARFNTERPAINALIDQMKAPEAVAKAEALIPTQAPVFNAASLQTIYGGLDDGRAYSMMHHLLANTLGVAGQWEKAKEVQEKRLAYTKALEADILKGLAPIEAQWQKVAENAKAYIAKNEPRKAELETKLKAIQEEIAEVNAKKRKLNKEQMADLQARAKVAEQEQQELTTITSALPVEKDNLGKEQKIRTVFATLRKESGEMVTAAQDALAKIQKTIDSQATEIQKFNDDQNAKAKKAKAKKTFSGSKDWVEAVLRDKKNITDLPKPQDQYALLNRLHVLAPENNDVRLAIENLQAGRDPFFKAKAAPKAKRTK